MLEEAVQVLLAMWTEDEARFIGEHYSVDGAINRPKPLQSLTRHSGSPVEGRSGPCGSSLGTATSPTTATTSTTSVTSRRCWPIIVPRWVVTSTKSGAPVIECRSSAGTMRISHASSR